MIKGARHQELSRLVESHIRNHAVVRRHRVDGLLLPQVPDLHRVVIARRGELEPVRRKAAAQHSLHMSLRLTHLAHHHLQRGDAPSRPQVPDPAHAALVTSRCQTAVALEVQPKHLARVPVLQQELCAALHVPQAERRVAAHRAHEPPYASASLTTPTRGVELDSGHAVEVAREGVEQNGRVVLPAPQLRRLYG